MTPFIALLFCAAFIAFLLIHDIRRTPDASPALWIPFIWMLIMSSRPLSVWFMSGGTVVTTDDVLNGSPLDRMVLSLLIFAGLAVLARRAVNWYGLAKKNVWLLLWVLYGVTSILWSDFPGVAFKRWIKEIGTFVMVLIVMTDQDPVRATKMLITRCAYVLIPASILLIKYYRPLGVFYSPWGGYANLAGATTDKNGLGRLCSVSGILLFWTVATAWKDRKTAASKLDLFVPLGFFVLTFWLLIKVNSATSLGALLIGIACFAGLGLTMVRNNVNNLGALVLIVVFLFAVLEYTLDITGLVIAGMGRDPTLTGRTDLWKDLIALGASPLFGTGYDSFWLGSRLERLWEKYWWAPNEAHNGYLEVYLSLGLVGISLLAGILTSTFGKIKKTLMNDFDYGRFRMAFLAMMVFYNLTEAAFRGMNQMWFVFLLVALEYPAVTAPAAEGQKSPKKESSLEGERASTVAR